MPLLFGPAEEEAATQTPAGAMVEGVKMSTTLLSLL